MKKKNFIFSAAVLLMASAMVASCTSDDMTSETTNGKNVVTAKAILDETTRVAYNENTSGGGSGITATWESNDFLNALETNSGTTTLCTFTNPTIDTEPVTFTSTDAEATSDATTWKAVLGKGAKVSGTTITCGYDGQVGTPANLENYDYRVATGTGKAPTFNFTGSETRLTYFLRLKVPANIKQIELCTGSWTITSTANTAPTASTDNVSTVTLGNTSAAGEIVYVAVPAIDFSTAGLIITIFNDVKANATMSQGKVISRDLSTLGGKIGDYDLSGLTLMARETEPVTMGSYGKWARFNVGASASPTGVDVTAYGNYYRWGMTEPSTKYGTFYNSSSSTSSDVIINTKHDVARVKWGKGWRMPTKAEFEALNSNCSPAWQSNHTYGSASVNGVLYTNNGTTLFFPAAGYYNDNDYVTDVQGEWGYYWSTIPNNFSAYILNFSSGSTTVTTFTRGNGLSVRPVSE